MPGRRLVITVVLGVVLLVGGLALASCDGDGDGEATPTVVPTTTTGETEMENTGNGTTETMETTTTTEEQGPVVVRVDVVGGVPQGGIVRATVKKGDEVVLVVASDVANEVHLHGYDLSDEVAPGRRARISFAADVPGRFEVELEESGVQIADLTVRP